LNSPAWVIEGYATLIEGRVTGSGRPHGSWRPAFLREWALEGQLPRYEQLSNYGGFEGGEFRYLAGSAFLEWLAERHGDSSLVNLWRRMTAKDVRTFDAAFAGVFGESARAMYGRFSAEITANAVAYARQLRARFPADTGEIVQRLAWSTGDPSISRDGRLIAIRLSSPVTSRIVVWRTSQEPDTGRARRDSIARARDPEDVPARTIFPSPKKVLASLRAPSGGAYDAPRFLPDGRVLVERAVATPRGLPRTDLYIWNPQRGGLRRVTHGAALRLADPAPDGRTAAAMRCARGWCDIVRVDLERGTWTPMLEGDPTRSYYRPRFSRDGRRLVVAVHEDLRWRLEIVDAATLERRRIEVPQSAYDAAWIDDTTLVATADPEGVPQLQLIDARTGATRSLTHVTGAAVAAEPNPADRSIWFLSLYSSGYDLRQIRGGATSGAFAFGPLVPNVPVLADPPRVVSMPPANSVSPPRVYHAGARATRWGPIPFADADGVAGGLGFNNEDIIGRFQVIGRYLAGDRTWRGGSVDLTWRGTRPFPHAQLFDARVPALGRSTGGLFSLEGILPMENWAARWRVGGAASRIEQDSSATRSFGFVDAAASRSIRNGPRVVSAAASGSVTAGSTNGASFTRGVATLSASQSALLPWPTVVSASYAAVNADAPAFERVSLGGSVSPLLDRNLLSQRLAMPVLPAWTASGRSAFSYNITLINRPLSLSWWAGRILGDADPRATWHRVIGLEGNQFSPVIRSTALPDVRVTYGIGESLDPPLRRKVRGYVNVVLTP
jgi:hypothetical protein